MPIELIDELLLIVAKMGYTGADREVFFRKIRNIKYAELEKLIVSLEKEDLINIEWVGPSNFTVFITPKGVKRAKSYQQDILQKNDQAIKELKRTKLEEKSILHHGGVDASRDNAKKPENIKAVRYVPSEESIEFEKGILNTIQEATSPELKEVRSIPAAPEDYEGDESPVNGHVDPIPQPPIDDGIQQEAQAASTAATSEPRCIWEQEYICPVLSMNKSGTQNELMQNYCIVCQLVEIKRLLKK